MVDEEIGRASQELSAEQTHALVIGARSDLAELTLSFEEHKRSQRRVFRIAASILVVVLLILLFK